MSHRRDLPMARLEVHEATASEASSPAGDLCHTFDYSSVSTFSSPYVPADSASLGRHIISQGTWDS